MIVTAGCPAQLPDHEKIQRLSLAVASTILECQLLIRTQPHYFRLDWIKSQSAGTHPVINFTDALTHAARHRSATAVSLTVT